MRVKSAGAQVVEASDSGRADPNEKKQISRLSQFFGMLSRAQSIDSLGSLTGTVVDVDWQGRGCVHGSHLPGLAGDMLLPLC